MPAVPPLLVATVVVVWSLSVWAWRRRPRPKLTAAFAAGDARDQPLVVVVGLGGVGSHAAHLLLRSGVRRLRLIDFDQVTLSSLNRHATASRLDVGTPKATALRAALLAIDATADIEARVSLFCAEAAADLLCGGPALVVDAIDDIKTKAELQVFCLRAGLPVLSALGAGGKAECTSMLVAPLADVLGDPVAGGLFKHLKAEAAAEPEGQWWDALEQRVECVYSSEKQRVGLLPMPDGANAADLGSQPTFRARVLPVLPPVPAAFGAALASRALDLLPGNGRQVPAPAMPIMTLHYQRRLHVQFENEFVLGKARRDKAARKAARSSSRQGGVGGGSGAVQGPGAEAQAEEGKEGLAAPLGGAADPAVGDGGWPHPDTWPISFDDAGVLMHQVFRGRRARARKHTPSPPTLPPGWREAPACPSPDPPLRPHPKSTPLSSPRRTPPPLRAGALFRGCGYRTHPARTFACARWTKRRRLPSPTCSLRRLTLPKHTGGQASPTWPRRCARTSRRSSRARCVAGSLRDMSAPGWRRHDRLCGIWPSGAGFVGVCAAGTGTGLPDGQIL